MSIVDSLWDERAKITTKIILSSESDKCRNNIVILTICTLKKMFYGEMNFVIFFRYLGKNQIQTQVFRNQLNALKNSFSTELLCDCFANK